MAVVKVCPCCGQEGEFYNSSAGWCKGCTKAAVQARRGVWTKLLVQRDGELTAQQQAVGESYRKAGHPVWVTDGVGVWRFGAAENVEKLDRWVLNHTWEEVG